MSSGVLVKLVVVLLILIAALSGFSSYFWSTSKVQKKIHEAELNLAELKAKNEAINQRALEIERQRKNLEEQIQVLKTERDSLRFEVVQLEENRKEQENFVDNLFQPTELSEEMKKTFPELGETPLGLMEVDEDGDGFAIEYFMIPTQFLATFISDHQNAENFKLQNERLRKIESNLEQNLTLSNQVVELADEKAAAYKEGYQEAFNKYEQLNQQYINVLRQPPKVKLGMPSMTTILGAAAVGMAAGIYIDK